MTDGHRRERAGKARLAALLEEHATHLCPGPWRLIDMQHAVTDSSSAFAVAWAAVPRDRGGKRALVTLRRFFTAPRVVRVAGTGDVVEVQVTKDHGLVGFDESGRSVIHMRRTPLSAGYSDRRRMLGDRYPILDWTLSADHRILVEGRADGVPMACWDEQARVDLLQLLLENLADELKDAGQHAPLCPAGVLALAQAQRDPRWLSAADSARKLGEVPVILAHGDLTPQNVMGSGPGSWVPIDFEDARVLPFFYDPLSLVIRDRALVAAMRDGVLAPTWHSVLSAAGLDEQVLPFSVAADMTALLAAEHHQRAHGGDADYTLRDLGALSI